MKYLIYPAIGVARIGNSPEIVIGPETADSLGTEIQGNSTEIPSPSRKDSAFRMKKQAARFRLFQDAGDGSPIVPAVLPEGASVTWSVRLVNKKDAVIRPDAPPSAPLPVATDPARANRVIDSGKVSISTASGGPATRALAGSYAGVAVSQGQLRLDPNGNLLVVPANGVSASPSNAPIGVDFYNNPDWYDDLGDGPVEATVHLPGGQEVAAAPAWIMIGPPDFAPGARGIVTLWDVVTQSAINAGLMPAPAAVYFDTHVRPLIANAASLRWVNPSANWDNISQDWAALSDPSPANQALRDATANRVLAVEAILQQFEVQAWQKSVLAEWVAGNFQTGSQPGLQRGQELTRAVLNGTVGQGFFPGIESGILITDAALYSQPFEHRLDHAKIAPGDLTALMALPWQADFLKCSGGWWPAQRPGVAPQVNGPERQWLRPTMTHARLVVDAMRLGVIEPDGVGNRMVERGRDSTLA